MDNRIYVIKNYYGKNLSDGNGYFVPIMKEGNKISGHIFCSVCVGSADTMSACASPLLSYTKRELIDLGASHSCVLKAIGRGGRRHG